MLTVHSIQVNSSKITLHTEPRQETLIVFQTVQTYLILSPARSLSLDFNLGPPNPDPPHSSDSSLGFINDIKS